MAKRDVERDVVKARILENTQSDRLAAALHAMDYVCGGERRYDRDREQVERLIGIVGGLFMLDPEQTLAAIDLATEGAARKQAQDAANAGT